MGNVVGLPEMVIPVAFNPVASGSPRRNPTSVGIYAPPNQDSTVMIIVTWLPTSWTSGVHIASWSACCMGQAALFRVCYWALTALTAPIIVGWCCAGELHHHCPLTGRAQALSRFYGLNPIPYSDPPCLLSMACLHDCKVEPVWHRFDWTTFSS